MKLVTGSSLPSCEVNNSNQESPSSSSPKLSLAQRKKNMGITGFQTSKQCEIKSLFTELEANTPHMVMLGSEQTEHRCFDIACPEKTALKIGDQFLHANYVNTDDNCHYIITQSPKGDGHELFWKKTLDGSDLIIDLSNPNDQIPEKNYPTAGVALNFGSIQVKLTSQKDLDPNTTISCYEVTNSETGEEKEVRRINYHAWKDHGGTSTEELAALIDLVDQHLEDCSNLTPIVHCRAGVGRSGTFVTARTLKHLQENGKINTTNLQQVLKDVILACREQRGPNCVQTSDQLKTVMDYGKHLLETPKHSQEEAAAKQEIFYANCRSEQTFRLACMIALPSSPLNSPPILAGN